jgi:hypothetical protein
MRRVRDIGLLVAALAVAGAGGWLLIRPPAQRSAAAGVPEDAGETPNPPPATAGGLVFPKPVADLGSINTATEHSFAFENRGPDRVLSPAPAGSGPRIVVLRDGGGPQPWGPGPVKVRVVVSRPVREELCAEVWPSER